MKGKAKKPAGSSIVIKIDKGLSKIKTEGAFRDKIEKAHQMLGIVDETKHK